MYAFALQNVYLRLCCFVCSFSVTINVFISIICMKTFVLLESENNF